MPKAITNRDLKVEMDKLRDTLDRWNLKSSVRRYMGMGNLAWMNASEASNGKSNTLIRLAWIVAGSVVTYVIVYIGDHILK